MKIRVLFAFGSSTYSGAERVMERLLVASREAVESSALVPPGQLAENFRAEDVVVHESTFLAALGRTEGSHLSLGVGILLVKRLFRITGILRDLMRSKKYHVIHANNLAGAVYLLPALMISKLERKPTVWVWTSHDIAYYDGWLGTTLAAICSQLYDRTIAVSEAVRSSLLAPKGKVALLYNGLDTEVFRFNDSRRRHFRDCYQIGTEDIVFAIVGPITERKGHKVLIDAFDRLCKDCQNIVLLIAGEFARSDGTYREEMKERMQMIRECRIILAGYVDNIVDLYCGVDVLVNASNSRGSEPLGTTICEAMSCERLIIASRTGGTPEIISDGVDGFLFEPGNSLDLVEKMRYCCGTSEALQKVRTQARTKVCEKFNINNMQKAYLRILSELIAGLVGQATRV